ncbi:MAG TPA: helix-turn-helix domain-containing protein [Pseudonocardiaceae bacterium]|nr:helix-turn-helix domain-containing protein [Pseudonocardiaceae bacterium]
MDASSTPLPLELSPDERQVLTEWTRRHTTSQALAVRSRIVLEYARGRSNTEVAERLGISRETVRKRRSRFVRDRSQRVEVE